MSKHRSSGEHLAQLRRMRDMKAVRLLDYRGPEQSKSFLRADIGALNFAIRIIEGAQRADVLRELEAA